MSDEDPFEDLDVEPLEPADGDEIDADVEDLFTEVEIGEVDDEAVWAELTGEAEASTTTGADGVPADGADLPTGDDDEGTVVPKASYCQKCEYFSDPPAVECGNDGTEILELVDVDHFRVRNCPVVARRSSATRGIADEDDD